MTGTYSKNSSDARAALERQEEMLIEALLQGNINAVPVSPRQIAAASRSLLLKRARVIARSYPQVLDQGHSAFVASIKEYASHFPGIHPDGCCADAARYLRFCQSGTAVTHGKSNRLLIRLIECFRGLLSKNGAAAP